jgi:hypothetical protein
MTDGERGRVKARVKKENWNSISGEHEANGLFRINCVFGARVDQDAILCGSKKEQRAIHKTKNK